MVVRLLQPESVCVPWQGHCWRCMWSAESRGLIEECKTKRRETVVFRNKSIHLTIVAASIRLPTQRAWLRGGAGVSMASRRRNRTPEDKARGEDTSPSYKVRAVCATYFYSWSWAIQFYYCLNFIVSIHHVLFNLLFNSWSTSNNVSQTGYVLC